MPDQTIDQLRASLKDLNERLKKLSRSVDRLEFIAYRYKYLSFEIDQIDVATFEVRQEFEKVREACKRMTTSPIL